MAFLFPIHLLFVYIVRGYYYELRYSANGETDTFITGEKKVLRRGSSEIFNPSDSTTLR